MHRILLVANQTLGCGELEAALAAYRGEKMAHILAPVTASEGENQWDYPSVDRFVPDRDVIAHALAAGRLEHELEQLERRGWQVSGEVVDSDPVTRLSEVLATDQYDEVLVCTLPERLSHWLRRDLPARIARATEVPVRHVEGSAGPSL